MPNFYFSRFRLNKDFKSYYDKTIAVYASIDGKFNFEYRKDFFKFVDMDLIKEESESYIIGRIVKYKFEHPQKVIEDNSNTITEVVVKNKILAASKFIIKAEEGLIIFEEISSYIPKDTFPKIFEELFKKHNQDGLEISISPITDENVFFTRIKEVKKVKKIVISLVPSNPDNRDIWKKMDEKLKDENVTHYKEVLENKSPDGSITIDKETESKFFMSEDGYGKSTVQGLDDNNELITISTKDADKHTKKRISFDTDDIRFYIGQLKSKVTEIINRTKKNN
jgi:hypothetical protein